MWSALPRWRFWHGWLPWLAAEALCLRFLRWAALDTARREGELELLAALSQPALLKALLFVASAVGLLWLRGADAGAARAARTFSAPLCAAHLACAALLALLFWNVTASGPGMAALSRHPALVEAVVALAWLGVTGSALALLLPRGQWRRLADGSGVELAFIAGAAVCGFLLQLHFAAFEQLWAALLLEPTRQLATAIAQAFGIPARAGALPSHFGTPTFTVDIGPTCLGYQGLGIVLAALCGYCLWQRRALRWQWVAAVLPLAVLLMMILNAVRIAVLVGIGSNWSPAVAVMGFHSTAGWLEVIFTLGLAVGVLQRWGQRAAVPQRAPRADVLLLLPLAAFVAAALATQLLAADFEWGYPLRVVVATAVLWRYRRSLPGAFPVLSPLPWLAGGAVFAAWVALVPDDPGSSARFAAVLFQAPPAVATLWLLARCVGAIAVVPYIEELAFRAYLVPRLLDRLGAVAAPRSARLLTLLASAILFGALHGHWLAGALAGLVYTAIYLRRGCLREAVTAHLATNAALALFILVSGRWSYW